MTPCKVVILQSCVLCIYKLSIQDKHNVQDYTYIGDSLNYRKTYIYIYYIIYISYMQESFTLYIYSCTFK